MRAGNFNILFPVAQDRTGNRNIKQVSRLRQTRRPRAPQPAAPRPVRLSPWTPRTDAPTHRRTPECAHISLPLTRSLGLCAHFAGCAVNLPPRIKNVRTFVKTDGRLAGRLAERKSAHKWTMPLGEVASAGNVRTNQENGLRREGNVRTFRGAWVRRCVGASVRRAPPAEPA